ncbi:MAG: acyl-CoA dehydrogenase [Firmicutes bacterium]|nr:acyl-CoA dehydrogenase [Bacillota bacterium]
MPAVQFTQQQDLLRKVVKDFVEKEIAPIASSLDTEDKCPVDLLRKMGAMGFNGVFVPAQYGGAGLGHTERAIILEEISRHAAGFAMALMTHHLGVAAILYYGTEEQKKKYLPELCSGAKIGGLSVTEPTGGSDFMGQQASAEFVDGQWVINGRKCFITNSHIADINVVTAKTGVDPKGRPQLTAFIIKAGTEGFGPGRKESKFGLRGSFMGDVNLSNVKVDEDAVVGGVGGGAKLALSAIGEVGRAGMAAISVGLLRACLEDSVKFAKERVIYGKPLAKLTNIQFAIAENRTDYEAARLMTYNAMGLKDSGAPCSNEVAMAKFFATEAAVRAAKRTIDLMGGYGVVNDYPVGRYLRDAVATIPSGGTSHIMQIIIAGSSLA